MFRIAALGNKRPPPEDIQFIRDEIEHYLGRPLITDVEFVDAIAPESSGKLMFSKSSVASEYIGKVN